MKAKVFGKVQSVIDRETKKKDRKYVEITLLQEFPGQRPALVTFRSWDGLRPKVGEQVEVVAEIQAYLGHGRTVPGLSVDVFGQFSQGR